MAFLLSSWSMKGFVHVQYDSINTTSYLLKVNYYFWLSIYFLPQDYGVHKIS